MTPAGLPPPPQPWPPLRIAQKRPWTQVRDVALTLCAWVFLAWILRGVVFLAHDFLRAPVFQVTKPLHSWHNGKLYDVHYYCDICAIDQVEPGPCMCCREEVHLVEEPVKQVTK